MFNQMPYMMASPMYNTLPLAGNVATSAFPSTASTVAKGTSLLKKINWSSLLSNAQKTLNVVNQAIPLYYQVKPVFSNIKTLSKIGKEFSKVGSSVQNETQSINNNETNSPLENLNNEELNSVPNPKFFL